MYARGAKRPSAPVTQVQYCRHTHKAGNALLIEYAWQSVHRPSHRHPSSRGASYSQRVLTSIHILILKGVIAVPALIRGLDILSVVAHYSVFLYRYWYPDMISEPHKRMVHGLSAGGLSSSSLTPSHHLRRYPLHHHSVQPRRCLSLALPHHPFSCSPQLKR